MSSTIYAEQIPSSVQTRRAPIRNDEVEDPPNRRSLSGKFRNFFRKNSSSPTRSTAYSEGRSPRNSTRGRSRSPSPIRAAIEAPHLRAPVINWPFGKKKQKSSGTTSDKPKRKENRRSRKSLPPSIEISHPIYEPQQPQQHQTSIRGQNFVPRTPELTHGSAAAGGRIQSSSGYDTPTKGFRDYTVIENTKSYQQVILSDADVMTPPPYTSDRSRSPTLPDTSIERSYYENSPPATDIELVPYPQYRQHTVGETSLGAAAEILLENNPLRSSMVIQPTHVTVNSEQWKNTSHSSLNNTELRSTTSSMDVDTPKLNAPLIPLGRISSKKEVKQTNSQSPRDDTYNSSSAVNNRVQSARSTYSSLPETYTIQNESFNSLKPTKSNSDKYPTLSAIVEHHVRRNLSVHFNEHTNGTNSKYPQRFDTSTTTNGYDRLIASNKSPSSARHHDGYIRPLTPPKSPVQPDVNTIHVDLNELRGQSSHYNSVESPIIYRSSTVIYTRDKHNYGSAGEIRTWNVQDTDNLRKPSTSIQIFPSRVTNEYHYTIGANGAVYENERQHHYTELMNTSHTSPSSMIDERDQFTRSYKVTAQTQESHTPRNTAKYSEGEHRHYTLKRTNSYDGLGIYISADADTRLNHRIRDIEPNSPGSRIGLRINDRITHINGLNVENIEFGDVLVLIKQGFINNHLQLTVINES